MMMGEQERSNATKKLRECGPVHESNKVFVEDVSFATKTL
jgi:hypothetical protein